VLDCDDVKEEDGVFVLDPDPDTDEDLLDVVV
jgi:hypothetical protein